MIVFAEIATFDMFSLYRLKFIMPLKLAVLLDVKKWLNVATSENVEGYWYVPVLVNTTGQLNVVVPLLLTEKPLAIVPLRVVGPLIVVFPLIDVFPLNVVGPLNMEFPVNMEFPLNVLLPVIVCAPARRTTEEESPAGPVGPVLPAPDGP